MKTIEHAADLAALARSIKRAAVDVLAGAIDTTDRAAVLAAVQDIERLASVATGRADALAALLVNDA